MLCPGATSNSIMRINDTHTVNKAVVLRKPIDFPIKRGIYASFGCETYNKMEVGRISVIIQDRPICKARFGKLRGKVL